MTSSKRSSLAAAIKQGKPFKSPQQELYISIVKTASELSLSTGRFLRAYGITQVTYNVLRILQGSGPEGLGRNEISERMITPAPDMTRLLDRMERDGLVVRTRGQEDKRQVATTITQTGSALLARVEGPLLKLHVEQLAKLPATEIRAAIQWLEAVREGISEEF
jgi:DNA-binding MarR family transcriptional regulator